MLRRVLEVSGLSTDPHGDESAEGAGEQGTELAGEQTTMAFSPGFIDRWRGPVLTNGSLHDLADCIRNQGKYTAKKVITAWGPTDAGGWTADNIRRVCHEIPPNGLTIVRTITGSNDKGVNETERRGYKGYDPMHRDKPEADNAYLNPAEAETEIRPWWNAHHGIWVELGNEPNNEAWYNDWRYLNGDPRPETDVRRIRAKKYVEEWARRFTATLDYLRSKFPGASFISPGLQCRDESWKHLSQRGSAHWYLNCRSAFSRADKIGFHLFGAYDFYGRDPASWAVAIMEELTTHYPNHRWVCTEYGLHAETYNDNSNSPVYDATKGRTYAELVHFGRGESPWPWNVEAATYFHFDMRPRAEAFQPEYHIYDQAGDRNYRERVTSALAYDACLYAASNDSLQSIDRICSLVMQADGNLVLYGPSGSVWSSGTWHRGSHHVRMQSDGNLVIRDAANRPLWASNTQGNWNAVMVVKNSGKILIYTTRGKIVWSAGTP